MLRLSIAALAAALASAGQILIYAPTDTTCSNVVMVYTGFTDSCVGIGYGTNALNSFFVTSTTATSATFNYYTSTTSCTGPSISLTATATCGPVNMGGATYNVKLGDATLTAQPNGAVTVQTFSNSACTTATGSYVATAGSSCITNNFGPTSGGKAVITATSATLTYTSGACSGSTQDAFSAPIAAGGGACTFVSTAAGNYVKAYPVPAFTAPKSGAVGVAAGLMAAIAAAAAVVALAA
jgi:hypothetical protein